RPAAQPPGGIPVNLLTLLVTLVVSLLVLEGVARLLSPPSPFSPYLPLRPHDRIALETDMPGVSHTGTNTTNKWGFRGEEPPRDWKGTYTIVAIGGSTTQCFYLDDAKTWPARLEQQLTASARPVWVGNGGLDGQSTRAHVIFMEQVISKIHP